ncbi:toxin-antitoxin system YwqK family antitoxin [Flavobacterium sp. 3HN19-14]|uniref:toxin-antitoxin system YwqK family antitoxin n=1 Tax=Flavobacterium sp. 3HN19-14 TaxID=3448133 RepID=UPI003EE3910A
MKTKLLNILLVVAFALQSFSDPYTIKRITDTEFKYEFYTTDKVITPKENRTYYWFKGGAIHNSQSGMAGLLLDGDFTKMYLNNQLAEQGEFSNGLRNGLWKTWYPNGILESSQYWKKGRRKNTYQHFDISGKMLEKGEYKKGLKDGEWIDYTKNDTTSYKKGIVVVKKPKLTKEEKAKIKADKALAKAEKKKTDAAAKAAKKAKKAEKSDGKGQVKPATKTVANPEKQNAAKKTPEKKDKTKTTTNVKG